MEILLLLYWINLLHLYQPPTQALRVRQKIARQCYRPLSEGLVRNPKAKFVLNLNASLTEQLVKDNLTQIIKNFQIAARRGQIELTGSAAYHPILPFLPKSEITAQIKLNQAINQKYFGSIYQPLGFFPPEMAWGPGLAKVIKKLGYKYVFLDKIALSDNPIEACRSSEKDKLRLFLRNRQASNFLAFTRSRRSDDILKKLGQFAGKRFPRVAKKTNRFNSLVLITALDGETFGHHRKGFDKVLFEIYEKAQSYGLKPILPSELLSEPVKTSWSYPLVKTRPCSWASTEKELKKGIPYALWDNPKNKIHRRQHRLFRLALRTIKKVESQLVKETNLKAWRNLASQSLHSDQFWWASGIRLKKERWHPGLIKAGAKMLLEVVRTAPNTDPALVQRAEKVYDEIKERLK